MGVLGLALAGHVVCVVGGGGCSASAEISTCTCPDLGAERQRWSVRYYWMPAQGLGMLLDPSYYGVGLRCPIWCC